MNFADAHRHARERARHELDVKRVIAQMSKKVTCGSRNCLAYFSGDELSGDYDCDCFGYLREADYHFIQAVLNYLKGNYEAIMPLEESKRLDNEAFEKLFPRDEE